LLRWSIAAPDIINAAPDRLSKSEMVKRYDEEERERKRMGERDDAQNWLERERICVCVFGVCERELERERERKQLLLQHLIGKNYHRKRVSLTNQCMNV
jgi:hypothetical protein